MEVANRFHSNEGSKGITFSQPFERGIALPSEDGLTCCVQWWGVHRGKDSGLG